MKGFSQVVLEDHGQQLNDEGRDHLQRVCAGADRMGELIDGLLALSLVTRMELSVEPVRLDVIARRVLDQIRRSESDREVEIEIAEPIEAPADKKLLESALENLLGNAWKFTARAHPARIEVGVDVKGTARIYFVRDNGAGFEMRFADKLFAPFQRLHSQEEFPGTGIGLATTQRIVHRHGGRIWADSRPRVGTTFYFTLE
jgi:light-regulated signal transduction histidine kinase (bacteriophytochrome)